MKDIGMKKYGIVENWFKYHFQACAFDPKAVVHILFTLLETRESEEHQFVLIKVTIWWQAI